MTATAVSAAAFVAGNLSQAPPAHAARTVEAATTVTSVNGEVDAVVLSAADVGAASLAELDAVSIVTTPQRFPGIDPTGVEDSSAGLQKALSECPPGGTVLIPPGTYRVATTITNTGKSMNILGYGATLLKASDARILQLSGVYETPFKVLSTIDVVLDETSGQPLGIEITLGASAPWNIGEIVKLVADNVIPGGRPGTGTLESRVGQYFVVHSVSGTKVRLLGRRRETYSTNVRVSRLLDNTVNIHGLTMSTTPEGVTARWKSEMCSFSSLIRPAVRDVTILHSGGPAIVFRGCYGYVADNVGIDSVVDDEANGNFGYGILDNASTFGRVSRLYGRKLRHAYTDDTARVEVNSSVSQYGGTYGTRISDSVCHGSTQSSWDTHSCSENVTFTNCVSVDSFRGFNLRGRKHSIIDSSAYGGRYGARFTSPGTAAETSWGHRIEGFYAEKVDIAAIIVDPFKADGSRETRESTIRNVTTRDCGVNQIQISNATVAVDGLRLGVSADVPSGATIVRILNSSVRATQWDIEFPDSAADGLVAISARDEGLLQLTGLSVTIEGGKTARIASVIYSDRSVPVYVKGASLPGRIPAVTANLFFGSSFEWTAGPDHSGFIRKSEASVASASTAGEISRSSNNVIFLDCVTTSVRQLAPLLDGALIGQLLIVSNSELSSSVVRVAHGTTANTYIAGKATKSLDPGVAITLAWSGAIWRSV
jgi:hypothetical protein